MLRVRLPFLWSACVKVNATCTYRSLSRIEKAHFQALAGDKQLEKGEERQQGEEEAELYANTPVRIRVVTVEGMTRRRISCKATSFQRAPRASRPPPDEWVSQEGPAPLHRWGNWGTRRRDDWPEASLKDLRRSGEPEAPILSGGCSNHGLPPPLWWRRRPPPPQLTHPPREGHVSSASKDRVKKEGPEALPPWFADGERWERASLQSNMAAAAAAPPPQASLRAGGSPSGPSGGREDVPTPPGPFSPLPLLAEGVTYPTWLTAAARSPQSPPRTRNTRARRRGGRSCTEGGAAGWARLRGLGSQSEGSGRYHSARARGVVLYEYQPPSPEDFTMPLRPPLRERYHYWEGIEKRKYQCRE